jgi:heterodisulfide reductase subunit A2
MGKYHKNMTINVSNTNRPKGKIGAVTVIGGGIAGIQAALDVAAAGFKVYLIESRPSVGGVMAQLDKTFPTNDCSSCMLGPKLVEMANHPDIKIFALSEVMDVSGEPGHFEVTVKKKARAVDSELCVSCGLCAQKCPVKVPDEFNSDLNKRKAIFLSYPQAVPATYTIDRDNCLYLTKGKCRICEEICPKNAIAFDQQDEIVKIGSGAVIVAGGVTPFDAALKPELGYKRWPNVVTSIEYERILSAAGPFEGHIQRTSDGQTPRRIAWIQCVGSRDTKIDRDYCSSVCCMYATKQAIMTREHNPQTETTIFFIDIRAHGKGFERYYERAKSDNKVNYIRAMISRVASNPADDSLDVVYTTEAPGFQKETFDMVVLSVGLERDLKARQLAERIGIGIRKFGFYQTDPINSVVTDRKGFFVCGAGQEPKDIPDSVCQAGSAAGCATALLAEARGAMVAPKKYPAEIDISSQEPRVGVFICHCGLNIAGVVDVKAVAEYARSLPDVAFADDCIFACASDQQQEIINVIKKNKLNRVLVASCTPRTHETLFQDTLREAGLNPYLFELANIREQNAWVHQKEPEAATQKAKDLVRMSVARARLLQPLTDTIYDVVQRALIIGGGLAGLTAAISVAKQGFEAVLVEKSPELGGHAKTLNFIENGASPAEHIKTLAAKVEKNPLITVYTETRISAVSGSCGAFKTTLAVKEGQKWIDREISHGVIILCSGAKAHQPTEYLYGQHPKVMTQQEFEILLVSKPDEAQTFRHVAMIQCVGSREPEHRYCSRVCCTAAVKNSLRLKDINPAAAVSILYRDMRTFGLKENYYLESRQKGVRYFRFQDLKKPEVSASGDDLQITVVDELMNRPMRFEADLLVLSNGIHPADENQDLAETLRLPLDEDGFFMEAHPKLRPLDFAVAGVYLCGLAHGPKFAVESIVQAQGAVARAMAVLSKKTMTAEPIKNQVDQDLCRACGECERTCSFEAITVKEVGHGRNAAVVNGVLCTGCGACNVACPTGASALAHFSDDQVNAMIENIE